LFEKLIESKTLPQFLSRFLVLITILSLGAIVFITNMKADVVYLLGDMQEVKTKVDKLYDHLIKDNK